MQDFIIRAFMMFNTFLIRLSGGRVGSRLGMQKILLLHTVGRNSGQPRVTPVAYFRDGQDFIIVASNWGKDRQADWYLNLKKRPGAEIQADGRTYSVEAHVAEGDEYDRLWAYATGHHPQYLQYQKMTARRIPIVVFKLVS
jgi:deazaflavin-dependent oxidoreductase (nitroreductase family)